MHDTLKIEAVMRYHERTKHHFNRYAAGPGRLDWANQPDPFRRYDGARMHRLPILGPDEAPQSPPYQDLYRAGSVPVAPLTLHSLASLFQQSLAISAWKQAGGTRWALRCNPSSGNLHPTEAYLLIGPLDGLSDTHGLYHYAPREHGLERRADCPNDLFAELMRSLPSQAMLIGLASVHWREAWKYGERAFRYCQHDVGHAIGTLRLAAAALGWRARLVHDMADETVAELLGLNRLQDFDGAEREHPDLVMAIWPPAQGAELQAGARPAPHVEPPAPHSLTRQVWYGQANRLSQQEPRPWEVIDEVTAASCKPLSATRNAEPFDASVARSEGGAGADGPTAAQIIQQRRSLQACDGQTAMCADAFYRMLARLMPRAEQAAHRRPIPWDAISWQPAIHLGLFVHCVDGLEPGLYILVRDATQTERLKRAMHDHFAWSTPAGGPAALALLQTGDARRLATQLSCHQDIAGDGAFSLGMIADYRQSLFTHGPWFYRRLFWEAGLIGQVLYLEAEAAGLRSTGIGCYFDDPVHQAFGLKDLEFQSLYHFTVGAALEDPRLTTLEPYDGASA